MKNNIKITNATNADIEGVLTLQSKYLVTNLSAEEKKDGFVTTPFTIQQIENIILEDGLFVAKDDDEMVAYVFAGSWGYFSQWPIFPLMTSRFGNLRFNDTVISTENSFQYGPICIDKKYRGSGLLLHIFEYMRLHLKARYPISVTFINKINTRSFNAHVNKLKWIVVDTFDFNNNSFLMLALDMNVSVLD